MRSRFAHLSVRFPLCVAAVMAAACGEQSCVPGSRTTGAGSGAGSGSRDPQQVIVLEIDQMSNTPEVPLSVRTADGRDIKLEDIFAPAGIRLDVRRDRRDLPHAAEVTLADLHGLMLDNRNRQPLQAGAIGVHLIVATKEFGRPRDLGIMFDYGDSNTDNLPREGFAVFADVHQNLPAGREPELLLTIAHELTHVLNLHHADWEGGKPESTFHKGSTIESYSSASDVIWALSKNSVQHLRSDPAREKWPGGDNLAFGFVLRDHFKRHQSVPPDEPWSVIDTLDSPDAKGRHARTAVQQSARAVPRDRRLVASEPISLVLDGKTNIEVNEAFTLAVGLENRSKDAMHVRPLLDPLYGFLSIEVQSPGSDVFIPFRPAIIREARGVTTELLAPGGKLHDEAKVFFGVGGWTFSEPGAYLIRADFPRPGVSQQEALATSQRIESNTWKVQVVDPRTAAGRSASRLLSGVGEGFNLLIGKATPEIREAAALQGGASPQATAARLAVIVSAGSTIQSASSPAASIDDAFEYTSMVVPGVVGAFSFAQAYDQLAEALDREGKTQQAADVRRQMTLQIQKLEPAADIVKRIKQ